MIRLPETFEVEVKVPVTNSEEIRQRLLDSGARQLNSEVQVDTYFDHPCRSFQETDEAIRVRERRPIDGTDLDTSHAPNELTYKGPKIDQETKTRLEYSVDLEETKSITAILETLSFKPVAMVTKKRIFYILNEITISIDDVEHVGLFLELESIVHDKNEIESAKKAIFEILEGLGVDPNQTVRDSYLELYLSGMKQ
jgi:adenylate cyclase class 2